MAICLNVIKTDTRHELNAVFHSCEDPAAIHRECDCFSHTCTMRFMQNKVLIFLHLGPASRDLRWIDG